MASSNEPGRPASSAEAEPEAVSGAVPEAVPEDGKRRLPKQRVASRGSTVLGVAAIAAVGASGVAGGATGSVAAAQGETPVAIPISVHDVDVSDTDLSDIIHTTKPPAPDVEQSVAQHDAGETLLTRILAEVHQQHAADEAAALEKERKAAEAAAAKEAAAQKVRDEVAKKKAEEQTRRQAAEEAAAKAEQERLAQLAARYIKPLTSSTPTSGFDEAGSMWSAAHTGQDFAAPTGTPVMAVHSGTITSAGWTGAYGYRVVLTLNDGTQVWYCHLSSIVKTSGKVTTGDVIGRVGATGNSVTPHLHLEIHLAGGAPVDPLTWLWVHGAGVN